VQELEEVVETVVCVENHSKEPQTELFAVQEVKEVVETVKKVADEHSGDHGVGREPAPPPATAATTTTCVEEPQAQVYLGTGRDDELMEGWYLDTGATNHITERCDVFSHLDQAVRSSVKFGDGSVVAILGYGTVIFSGRNGEHKALDGVYHIPKLRNSIISVGQLDEIGSKIHIEDGVLQSGDQESRLLARVPCSGNMLYVLRLEVARPVCLTARRGDDAWRWHDRFGHIKFRILQQMRWKSMVR
jgi:hypothetical protein